MMYQSLLDKFGASCLHSVECVQSFIRRVAYSTYATIILMHECMHTLIAHIPIGGHDD